MSNLEILKVESTDLSSLFLHYELCIPEYQRPYSWDETQAKELWLDIIESKEHNSQHYFGPMYFVQRGDTGKILDVTDGQQRITTLTIMFFAFLHVLTNDLAPKSEEEKYVYEKLVRSIRELIWRDNRTVLQLGASDKDAFNVLRENYDTIKPNDDGSFEFRSLFDQTQICLSSADLVFHNLKYYVNMIRENNHILAKKGKDYFGIIEDMNRIIKTVSTGFIIIRAFIVDTKDKVRPFNLFETINDRGRQLDQVDKIKNYLFKNVYQLQQIVNTSENIGKYNSLKSKWSKIQYTLDNYLEEYIRYYLIQSNYCGKFIDKNNLYDSIKNSFEEKLQITSEQGFDERLKRITALCEKSIDLVNELEKNKKAYMNIVEPSKSDIKDEVIKANLHYAISQDYKLIRALLLKIMIMYSGNEQIMSKIIVSLVNSAMIYISVYKYGKQDQIEKDIYNKFFKEKDSKLLLDEYRKIATYVSEIYQKRSTDFTLDKNNVEHALCQSCNDEVNFFILCKLNDYLLDLDKKKNSGDYYYHEILTRTPKVSFQKDHILPKNYDNDYKYMIHDYFIQNSLDIPTKKDFTNQYIKRLGNIMPLKQTPNIKKSNTDDPMKFYKDLSIKSKLIQHLISINPSDEWGIDEILSRSKSLAKLIVDNDVLTLDYGKVKY